MGVFKFKTNIDIMSIDYRQTKNFPTEVRIVSKDDFDRHIEFDLATHIKIEINQFVSIHDDDGTYLIYGGLKISKIEQNLERNRYYCDLDKMIFEKKDVLYKVDHWEIELFGVDFYSEEILIGEMRFPFSHKIDKPFSLFEVKQQSWEIPYKGYDFFESQDLIFDLVRILSILSMREVCFGDIKAYNENNECIKAQLNKPKYIFEPKLDYKIGNLKLKKSLNFISELPNLSSKKYSTLVFYYLNVFHQTYAEFSLAFMYQVFECIFNSKWKQEKEFLKIKEKGEKTNELKNEYIEKKIIEAYRVLNKDVQNILDITPGEFFKLIKKIRQVYFHAGDLSKALNEMRNKLPGVRNEDRNYIIALGQVVLSVLLLWYCQAFCVN